MHIYIHTYIHIHTHISHCVETVIELPLLQNNTGKETFLHKSGAVRIVVIFQWDACLTVTVRIRNIGHNVLQSSFQAGISNSPQLLPHFLPYHIPRGGLCWKYNYYSLL